MPMPSLSGQLLFLFFLLQLSSAAAERVFFLIESFIGEQQNLSLQDYIETSSLEVGDFQVM